MGASPLFYCQIPVPVLKRVLDAVQPVSATLNLSLSEEAVSFNAVGEGAVVAMNGCLAEVPEAMGQAIQVSLDVRSTLQRLAACDPAQDLTLEVVKDGRTLLLLMRQGDTVREVSVRESAEQAIRPEAEQTGVALLELRRFAKVIASLQPHTDLVSVEVAKGCVNATFESNKQRDGWKHPCDTEGRGYGVFSSALLAKMLKGAGKLSDLGTLHVGGPENPLKVSLTGAVASAEYYLASRSDLKE